MTPLQTEPEDGRGQQCPPAPPSSPAECQRLLTGDEFPSPKYHQQEEHQHQTKQKINNLIQFAQSSYTTNPTDALSALMDALTLSTGTKNAALHAVDRIRSELGDVLADRVVAGSRSSSTTKNFNNIQTANGQSSLFPPQNNVGDSNSQLKDHPTASPLTSIDMTRRAMKIVQEMLNDTSTILYAQGRQHILQQAMEDGSSIVCSNCGDMISRERWRQHAEYWCRGIVPKTEMNMDEEIMEL